MYNIFILDSSKKLYYYLNNYFFSNNNYKITILSLDEIDYLNCNDFVFKKYLDDKINKSNLNIIINYEELNDKDQKKTKNIENYYKINSNLPLILANYCKLNNIKFIHLTNDCVYSGTNGKYNEDSLNDSQTNYSLSKTIGEKSDGTIIRVCLLGDEKEPNKNNFLGWLKINKNNEIYIEDNHYLNCITYLEFCKLIEKIIEENLFWNGIRHIFSPKRISKFELGILINDIYKLDLKINKLETDKIDRTLSTKYENIYNISDLELQIKELKEFESNLSNNNNKKISIVMAYYNRKSQTLKTLDGFEKQYAGKYNFEVIIVDDNSNNENKLEKDIKKYNFPINLIVISAEEKGDRINPCIAYNRGFEQTTGEIIIIQNPECYHVGNIISYTISNLKEMDYYSYSCFTANTEEITDRILNSDNIFKLIKNEDFLEENFKYINLNWYNHPTEPGRNVAYHFCSAIYKNKLELIGGFDKRFAQGYCFDDDEFLLSIKYNLKLKISIIDTNECFVLHQYHKRNDSFNCENKKDDDPIKSKWLKNKNLFEKIKYEHEKNDFIYPKLIFLYWDGSPLSYLNYLTVESFNYHNKEWKIIVFTPTIRTTTISWKTNEQKIKYTGKDYFYKLYDVDNLVVLKIDLDKIGFYNDASEVIKSDYFRYYILKKHGGLWSDFDIIYTGSIEEKMNFKENTVIFKCITTINKNLTNEYSYFYYPIGLFLSVPNSIFFEFIVKNSLSNYDKNEYQSIGAVMFGKLFPSDDKIFNIDNKIKILNNEYYLPWAWNELHYFLDYVHIYNSLPDNNIGIHWFNGADKSKLYSCELNNRLNNFTCNCFLDNVISKYFYKYKISIIMAYYNRKTQLIQTLQSILSSSYKNIEIIIVDDNSDLDQKVENFIDYYKKLMDVKLITIHENEKKWINPCVPYNIGIKNSTGDIIVLQNPEVLHVGDCLNYIATNLKQNDWLTFNCYGSPDYHFNDKIKNKNYDELFGIIFNSDKIIGGNSVIRNDVGGWLNHHEYHFVAYHYLAAIFKNDLINKMDYGFNEIFKNGIGSDDDEFIKRLLYNKFNFKISKFEKYNPFCVHLYHDKPKQLLTNNYLDNKSKFIEICKKLNFVPENDICLAPINEIPMSRIKII